MWVAFAFAKATHIFFSKNTCELDNVLIRTVNILATNELIKLTMLWTTGHRTPILVTVIPIFQRKLAKLHSGTSTFNIKWFWDSFSKSWWESCNINYGIQRWWMGETVNVLKFWILHSISFWPKFCFLSSCYIKNGGTANSADPDQIDCSFRVCLFVLRFYGPVNPMGSCQARSVYLTTHLLGRLSPLCD